MGDEIMSSKVGFSLKSKSAAPVPAGLFQSESTPERPKPAAVPTPDHRNTNEDELDAFMNGVDQEVTQSIVSNICNFGKPKPTKTEVRHDIEEDEDDIEGTIEYIVKKSEHLKLEVEDTEQEEVEFKVAGVKPSEEELQGMEARAIQYQAFASQGNQIRIA